MRPPKPTTISFRQRMRAVASKSGKKHVNSRPSAEDCQFAAYPGTVGWKYGFSRYRNAPVGDNGEELTPQQLTDATQEPPPFEWGGRRRFDRVRYGLFHYILYAHALGKPKSLPCLRFGQPATYDTVDTNGESGVQRRAAAER